MSSPSDDPRFTPQFEGRFMGRDGALGREAPFSNKKLCLVATDAGFLADLLYRLSLRADCRYVKYSVQAREGMYLGRCFLQSDEAVASLCESLKRHPRLMVSVQDDDFFNPYRRQPGAPPITDVWPHELPPVLNVVAQAFGRQDEAAMVQAVHDTGQATVSMLAGEGDEVVGHVLLSPVTVGESEPPGLGLAPVAVAPSHQRQGIGMRLVEAALQRARELGYVYVVVLGHPSYYPRFGFAPASRFGLRYGQAVPDEVFMALELVPGGLEGVSGVVRYHRAFE